MVNDTKVKVKGWCSLRPRRILIHILIRQYSTCCRLKHHYKRAFPVRLNTFHFVSSIHLCYILVSPQDLELHINSVTLNS